MWPSWTLMLGRGRWLLLGRMDIKFWVFCFRFLRGFIWGGVYIGRGSGFGGLTWGLNWGALLSSSRNVRVAGGVDVGESDGGLLVARDIQRTDRWTDPGHLPFFLARWLLHSTHHHYTFIGSRNVVLCSILRSKLHIPHQLHTAYHTRVHC